jgi:hypothetical protein
MSYINLPGGGSGGAGSWKDPVATFAALPLIGNSPGDSRATEDTGLVYTWDGSNWQSGVGSTSNSFAIIQPDSGTSPVADSSVDTLSLTSSSTKITISGNSLTDTIDFNIASGAITNTEVNGSANIQYSKMENVPSANILVGNGSNKAAPVAMTGDIAITSGGVTSINTGVIVDADVNASAAISRSKVASGSANHVVINDGSGVLSSEAQLGITRGGTGASTASAARANLSAASTSHASTHNSGGSDPLTGSLDANARLNIKNNGSSVGTRRSLNIIPGTGIGVTITDDSGNEEVDLTITSISAISAYTTTTASFVQPAIGANVTIAVGNSQWMATGQVIYISTGGYYSVVSTPTTISATITNLGYTNNANAGVTISSPSAVSPGGLSGDLYGNLDGGTPFSVYGGVSAINGGTP